MTLIGILTQKMIAKRRQRDPRLWGGLFDHDKNHRSDVVRTIKALEHEQFYAAELLNAAREFKPVQRAAAGEAISLLGDPRFSAPHFLPEMVAIPAGRVIMGSAGHRDEEPVHKVDVRGFALAQTPVTQGAYAEFVQATRHRAPRGWKQRRPSEDALNAPVVWVSARDAEAYCRWLSAETGYHYRLPTEAEWVLAARGADSSAVYPWGNSEPTLHANLYGSQAAGRLCGVGLFRTGRGPYGHDDLSGNVWEWCSSLAWNFPYSMEDGRENTFSADARVMHGGSWRSRPFSARCTSRQAEPPDDSFEVVGFRIARTSE